MPRNALGTSLAPLFCATALALAALAPVGTEAQSPLSNEARLRAREALERVYHAHRQEGLAPEARVPFETAAPRAALEAEVAVTLRESSALARYWTPITAEALQAEVDRMARDTRDPAVLRELFAALDDDPALIAECLARPALADRLARRYYAADPRLHSAVRARAEAALAAGPQALASWREGEHRLLRFRSGEPGLPAAGGWSTVSAEEFALLAAELPAAPGVVRLVETSGAFVLQLTSRRTARDLEAEVRLFPKVPFETWLQGESPETAEVPGADRLVVPAPRALDGRYLPDTWALEAFVPSPRSGHTAVWTGSEMIVWGGLANSADTNTGGRYRPALDAWESLPTTDAPSARQNHTAVWTGSEMVVWGGSSFTAGRLNNGARYNPVLNAWTALPSVPWLAPRAQHTAVWTGTNMIVWGGTGDAGELGDGGVYSPGLDAWSAVKTNGTPPAARTLHVAVAWGGGMIVWGGYNTASGFLSDGARYSSDAGVWTTLSATALSGRMRATAVWAGSEMIVWGGSNSGTKFGDGARYNPSLDAWTPLPAGGPSGRDDHTALWTGEKMLIWGGRSGVVERTGAQYNPATNSWSPTSTLGAPSARTLTATVWTGSEMLVWGGQSDADALDDGGRYNPQWDSWLPLAASQAPPPRTGHTAVWTGAEMIVWGGMVGTDYSQDGGRYSAALDTWSPLSTTGAPAGRYGHLAVWTGAEMIVWGGSTAGGSASDGGRYNPAANSWAATSLTGAPAGSGRPVGVWTGSQMIAWLPTSTTGGRFTPGAVGTPGTWTGMSAAGAPTTPSGSTAVWTGTEMIVWGGWNGSAAVATGGRYNPGNDAWTATATTGAPAARTGHTAVWTGREMVIWGGDTCGNIGGMCVETLFASGARYNPNSDAWTDLGTGGTAPVARCQHTAVWTGRDMIVWGGLDGPYVQNHTFSGDILTLSDPPDPALDSWRPTPAAPAPNSRYQHRSVWTGSGMIVYGGSPGTGTGILFPNTRPTSSPSLAVNHVATNILTLGGAADQLNLSHTLPVDWIDNVEGTSPWTPTGAWHKVYAENCSGASDYYSPVWAWRFGNSATCDYDGALGTYTLTSSRTFTTTSRTALAFRYFLHTDPRTAGGTLSFASGPGPFPIPDNDPSGVEVPIHVPVTGVVGRVRVSVNLYHTWDGDLTLSLVAPDNTEVVLCARRGLNGDNFLGTTFDDAATTPIASGTAPFTGSFIPDSPLAALSGKFTGGDWRLKVVDGAPGDSGSVYSWSLEITTAPAATVEAWDGSVWRRLATDAAHWGSAGDGFLLEDGCTRWHAAEIPLAPAIPAGTVTRIRFALTRDGVNGATLGWLLDDIGVGEPAGDGSLSAATVTCSDGSTATTPIPYHDAWDHPRFEWDVNGDGIYDNPDTTTPSFDLYESPGPGQAGLADFGLAAPGTYSIQLTVFDSRGLSDARTVTLQVNDGVPPTARVVAPNGAESWDYSPDDVNRKHHLIVWDAADNFGIARVRLSYTTDGSTWTCIADSAGTTCAAGVLSATDNSFDWAMPTQAEAAAAGQVFPSVNAKVRVEVWDSSDNVGADQSNASFYVIQPTAAAMRTLILTNTAWFTSLYGGSAAAQLFNKLLELAAHNKVSGVVLDLNNVPALGPLYADWDATPTDSAKANAVADGVRGYVAAQVGATYTNARYLVLTGDDRIIPHLRIADGTLTFSESQYTSQVDCTTTVGSAVCANQYLTDNAFGDMDYDVTTVGSLFLALPDLATGRLVETPQEMVDTINTFIAQNGQITLNKALVTGYDFLVDSAQDIQGELGSTGKPVDALIGAGWNAAALENALFTSPRHALHNLNDHSNHYTIGTPGGLLTTTQMDTHAGRPLEGTLFYNVGCHSALNVPPAFAQPLDLPELMLKKGVAAYVGNTGFGWGLRNGVGYSERLMELITARLLAQGTSALGLALADAKRDYFLENHRYDVFDEKVLFESTLYGLPMYQVVVSAAAVKPQPPELSAMGPDVQEAGGITQKKSLRGPGGANVLPPGVTELTLNFDFSAPGVYQKVTTADGSYYRLNGRTSAEVGDAIQPLFVYDSRLSGTVSHGVVFTGGAFVNESPFTPVVASALSNQPDNGPGPIAPCPGSFIPTVQATHPSIASSLQLTELTRMTVHTGYFHDGNVESRFNQMSFIVYYSNSADRTAPVVTDPGVGNLHTLNGLTANFSVEASDASGVYRVFIVYTDKQSTWQTFDLAYNGSSGRWEGGLALRRSVVYYVYAVDNAGNVGTILTTGPDLDVNGQPTGTTYTGARIFAATLPDTDGDGLPDAWETAHALNPNDATGANGANGDPDYDGFSNAEEFNGSTDPQNADSDGDGDNDGSEAHHARNPLLQGDGKYVTIAVTKLGNDIRLDWPPASGNNAVIDGPYWVYRSTTPFFGAANLLNPPPGQLPTGTTSYTDTGAAAAGQPTYYYTLVNARYNAPAPTVDVLSPATGPAAGGTAIAVYGSGFMAPATVTIAGVPCTSVVVVNDTKITCVTPPGSAGPQDVTVTNPNGQFGTKTGGFSYF